MRRLRTVALGALLLLTMLGSSLAGFNRGPTIAPSSVTANPSELPFTGGPVTVSADIEPATKSNGGCACPSEEPVAIVEAWLTVSPGALPPTAMTNTEGNTWQVEVPLPGNSTVNNIAYTLTVTATDADGQSAAPVTAQATVLAAPEPPPDEPTL